MTIIHYVGAVLVFLLVLIIGTYSAKRIKKNNFSGARSSKGVVIMGALIGTLVGGSSTIGTAQLAFAYGFSAWWFTLGGGIAVLLLGYLYKKPFYDKGYSTLPELIEHEYGKTNANLVTVLNSAGTFLSIVAQVISATALITAITDIRVEYAITLSISLIFAYVVRGGAFSLGYAGTLKTILISASILSCGFLALYLGDGFNHFLTILEADKYFSLFARGYLVDIGAGLSLIVGVLTTQSYVSAIVMAENKTELYKGTIATAIIVPLIGVAGIYVGMYMKIYHPAIDSKMALPLFIMNEMSPLIAGIMLGTLLLAVIGTAAGLSFGMAKMFYNSYLSVRNIPEASAIRIIIFIVLFASGILSSGSFGQYILNWSFLSMGLRGAVAFVPIMAALYLSGKIDKKYAMYAIFSGAIITFFGKFFLPANIDSLFPGIMVSFFVMLSGYILKK